MDASYFQLVDVSCRFIGGKLETCFFFHWPIESFFLEMCFACVTIGRSTYACVTTPIGGSKYVPISKPVTDLATGR